MARYGALDFAAALFVVMGPRRRPNRLTERLHRPTLNASCQSRERDKSGNNLVEGPMENDRVQVSGKPMDLREVVFLNQGVCDSIFW